MPKKLGEWFNGQSVEPRTFLHDTAWVLPACMVGVELELEGFKRRPDNFGNGYWQVVEDNSLRADAEGESGYELRFAVPLCGKDLTQAMEDLRHFLARRQSLKTTERTSLHVHLDVRDMTAQQFTSLLCLYAVFERMIFNYVGRERINNLYCVPWYAGEAVPLNLSLSLLSKNPRYVMEAPWKYAALNVKPVSERGSVEFRQHPGTIDVARIREWIQIILSLKKAAMDREALSIPPQISVDGPVAYARGVFGDLMETLTYSGLEQELWESMRLAQEMLHSADLMKAAQVAASKQPKRVGKALQVLMKKKGLKCPDELLLGQVEQMDLQELQMLEARYRDPREGGVPIRSRGRYDPGMIADSGDVQVVSSSTSNWASGQGLQDAIQRVYNYAFQARER